MARRSLSLFAAGPLAAAALVLAAAPADAAPPVGYPHAGSGFYPGGAAPRPLYGGGWRAFYGGYGWGYYGPSSGRGYYGAGYSNRGWDGLALGLGLGTLRGYAYWPYGSGYRSYGYYPGGYDLYAPGVPPGSYDAPPGPGVSELGTGGPGEAVLEAGRPPDGPPPAVDNCAYVRVRAPANAVVWFGGKRVAPTGPERVYVSPPLTPGQRYIYEVRARWVEGGRPVEEDRTVSVTANRWTDVDFTAAPPAEQAATQPAAPGRPATRQGSTPADDEPAPLPPAGEKGSGARSPLPQEEDPRLAPRDDNLAPRPTTTRPAPRAQTRPRAPRQSSPRPARRDVTPPPPPREENPRPDQRRTNPPPAPRDDEPAPLPPTPRPVPRDEGEGTTPRGR